MLFTEQPDSILKISYQELARIIPLDLSKCLLCLYRLCFSSLPQTEKRWPFSQVYSSNRKEVFIPCRPFPHLPST
jgi:hypothetical protein